MVKKEPVIVIDEPPQYSGTTPVNHRPAPVTPSSINSQLSPVIPQSGSPSNDVTPQSLTGGLAVYE